MANKPVLKIGHIKITDHLILGVTDAMNGKGNHSFDSFILENVCKTGWNQVADGLLDGELDGAFILAPTAMDIFKAGAGIKLLLFSHKNGSIIVTNKAANIRNIEDFEGKVVLVPYQLSIHNYLFHKMLADKGLRLGTGEDKNATVTIEVMAPVMMPEAIEYDDEGEIGGFIVAEPIGSKAIAAGYGEEFCLSKDLWPNHPCCVFVARDEVIEKHPDALHELVESLVRSGCFIKDNPSEAAKIGSNFLGQEQSVVERVLSEPKDRITTHELFPHIDDLNTIQDYMCDVMHVMRSKIDMERFVDTRFAETAGAK